MEQISRAKIKRHGLKRFFKSFKYSFDGLVYAYKNEQSMLVHLLGTILAIIMGIVCQINLLEWGLIGIALGVVLAAELINTAIEATVDMITIEINPLAKIAKDCGSAATFILTVITIILCAIIYAHHIIEMVG
jgi:diacylglycerol kinase